MNDTVRPMHDKYVEPSRQHADQLIDGTGNLNNTAKELLETWFKLVEPKSADMRQRLQRPRPDDYTCKRDQTNSASVGR